MGELNLRNAIILGTPSQQVQRVCNRILHVRGKKQQRKRRNYKTSQRKTSEAFKFGSNKRRKFSPLKIIKYLPYLLYFKNLFS